MDVCAVARDSFEAFLARAQGAATCHGGNMACYRSQNGSLALRIPSIGMMHMRHWQPVPQPLHKGLAGW